MLFAPLALTVGLALPFGATAQTTDAGQTDPTAAEKDVVILSPFVVSAAQETGYVTEATTAGTRFNTNVRDLASQVSNMTKEFLEDVAAVNIEEAFAYSLNVENLTEFQSTGGGGGDDYANGVINVKNNSRVRGLTGSSFAHDFFVTDIRLDAYNTERFTLSSGPNAILFGVGSPSGLADGAYKRAKTDRRFGSVDIRTDDVDSLRVAVDLNVPIIPKKLAVRLAMLRDEDNNLRKPATDLNRRFFATLTYQPFRQTTLRGWYEHIDEDRHPVRNAVIRDFVSPWIAAGRPSFNNAGVTSTAAATAALTAQGLTSVFSRYSVSDRTLTFGQWDSDPRLLTWNNTAQTRGAHEGRASPDNVNNQALMDGSIFPLNINYNSEGTRNMTEASIAGLSIEQSLWDKVFLELAYNRERRNNSYIDLVRGNQTLLYRDVNRFLNDGVTPNPGYDKYYVTGIGLGGYFLSQRDDFRLTGTYELDLTKQSKWLGRHRFAALVSQENTIDTDVQQGANLRVLSGGDPANDLTATSRVARVRVYLDDPVDPDSDGIYHVRLPWNGLDNYTMPDGTVIGGLRNGYGGTSNGTLTKNKTDSQMAMAQSYWLKNRLITVAGLRHDTVREATRRPQRRNSQANAPYEWLWEIVDDFPDWESKVSGNTKTLGVVFHATPWLSVHFNDSATFSPKDSGLDPDGSVIPGPHGEGQDYGFTLAPFGNKAVLRVNAYQQTAGPVGSTFQGGIRSQIQRMEETVILAGATPHPTYNYDLGSAYSVTENRSSKGVEVQLTANITKNWRMAISGTHTDTVQSEIGPKWLAFVHERSAVWGNYASLPIVDNPSQTMIGEFFGIIDDVNKMIQTDGAKVENGRDWRLNFTTNYTFSTGRLKGFFVGSSYRWRSKNAVGYEAREIHNDFPFPGIPDTIRVSDITKPIYGSPEVNFDGFIGYRRKLAKGRINWRVQLNVRNILDDDAIVEQAIYSDGSLRLYGVQEPRQFILTNRFEF